MDQLKEQIFISQLKCGDEGAYKELFNRFYPLMCSVAYSYVKDRGVCEQIADDVIFKIWERRDFLDITTSLQGYVLRAARNGALDYIRSKRANPLSDINSDSISNGEDFVGGGFSLNSSSHLFVSDSDLFEKIIATDLGRKIDEAIELLPKESKAVFCMSRFDNLTYEEIAAKTGLSVNTVKYHIKSALQKLRLELKDYLAIWPLFF